MSGVVVISVDGPVAAGKGTLAKRLATALGLNHLDSGLLYRATAARLLDDGADPADPAAAEVAARAIGRADLARADLRGEAVAGAASIVAAQPAVRAAVLEFQRRFAGTPPGAVIDGRDIGTVVCPDADAKLFVTASDTERARRRHAELLERGDRTTFDAVLAELRERDRRDSERAISPLLQAPDAVLLDTTELGAEDALQAALAIVRNQLKRSCRRSI